jgi:hypothetical protein
MAAIAGEVSAAIDLLVALIDNAQQISQLIQTAQASGQTTLTPAQWSQITGADNSAEAALTTAIAAAKAAGK